MKMLTFKKCLAATLALALPLTGAFGAVNITTQPVSTIATEGTSVTLSVTAVSTDSPAKALTYQWFKVGGVTVLSSSRTLTFSSVKGTDAGDYVVVVKESGVATTVDSTPATLTVNIKPRILTQPQSPLTPASEGGTASFSVTMNPLGTAPFTYTWQRKVGKNYVVLSNPNATITEPSTHTSQLSFANLQLEDVGIYRVSITNVTGTVVNSSDITLKVNLRPKIITEPAALTNLALGASKVLKVVVGGNAPFTFQWYKNNVAIAGATKDNYTVKGTTETAPGTPDLYRVEIFNPYSPGWANPLPALETITKTISANAEVHVIRKPVIATHPTSSPTLSTVVDPINHTLSVVMAPTTNPGTYTYQWQKDGKNIVDQNIATAPDPRIIAGTTTSTISFTPLSWLDRGSYRVIVKNEVGTITSKAADVKLLSKPLIVRQSPSQVFGNVGGSIKLFVVAGGTPASYKYEWFRRPLGGAFGTIPIGKAATLTLSKLSVDKDEDYKCVVTTASGSVESEVITLKVDIAPKIAAQTSVVTTPPDNTYAIKTKAPVGGKIQLQVVLGSGTDSVENPITYQWQKTKRNIVGATSRVLELTGLTLADSGKYRCIVKNFSGTATSNELTITIQTPPTITVQPTDIVTTIEESKLESAEAVKATGTATLKYKWEKQISIPGGGTAWSAVAGQTTTKLVFAKADIDLHNGTYRCVVSNEVGTANSNEITVEVQPMPVPSPAAVAGISSRAFYPNKARANEHVRIFGQNMQYTRAVTFGTAASTSVTIESSNAILVKVPSEAPLVSTPITISNQRGSANTAANFTRSEEFCNDPSNPTIIPFSTKRMTFKGNNKFREIADGDVAYEIDVPANHRIIINCNGEKGELFQFYDASFGLFEQADAAGSGTGPAADGVTPIKNVAVKSGNTSGRIYESATYLTPAKKRKYEIYVRRNTPSFGARMDPLGPFELTITITKLAFTSKNIPSGQSVEDEEKSMTSEMAKAEWSSVEAFVFMDNAITPIGLGDLKLGGHDETSTEPLVLWHNSEASSAATHTLTSFDLSLQPGEADADDQFGWQITGVDENPLVSVWVSAADGSVRLVNADGSSATSSLKIAPGEDSYRLEIAVNHLAGTWQVFIDGKAASTPQSLPAQTGFGSVAAIWDLGADKASDKAAVIFRNFKVEHSVAP